MGVLEELGGLRETDKFLLVEAFDLIRTQILTATAHLVETGRLDPGQVFDLHLAGLEDTRTSISAPEVRRGGRPTSPLPVPGLHLEFSIPAGASSGRRRRR